MQMLEFEESSHTYKLNGKEIPSVTTILKEVGFIDTTWFKDSGLVRGSVVHKATELLDQGFLDWFGLNEEYIPYVKAYEKFKLESGFQSIQQESKMYDDLFWFCGTVDRIGMLNNCDAILDIKTGQKQAWWSLQLAAYKHLSKIRRAKVYSLRLKKDGKYILDEYTDTKKDCDDFLSIVRVYHRLQEQKKGR